MTITVGNIYNCAGQNYEVTRYEPKHLLVQTDNGWVDAVELTDHVKEGETATVNYVLPQTDFEAYYVPGEVDEEVAIEQPIVNPLPTDNPLPAGETEGEAQPKG